MDYFQIHKQKLVFEDSNQTYAINDTPFDRRLRAAYEAIDKDEMEINLCHIEREPSYKEEWNRFLQMVYTIRDKRNERFNEICMKLKDHNAICYQIKNSDSFCFNEIEGLWLIVRGDVWRSLNPSIFINNTDVEYTDVVFLQFEDIYIDHEFAFKLDDDIMDHIYKCIQLRYLTLDSLEKWLTLIQNGRFGKQFTTLSILKYIDGKWVPKKYIYYFHPEKIGELDGIVEYKDGKLDCVPLKATKRTNALQRTLMFTNKDCEKYCSLVNPADSKPYAPNALYNTANIKHRTRCSYQARIYNLEFKYKEYEQYFENLDNIENICLH
jgi:hypothetical protein